MKRSESVKALSVPLQTCAELFPPTNWRSTAELTSKHEVFGRHPFSVCFGDNAADQIKVRMKMRSVRFGFRMPHNRGLETAVWGPIAALRTKGTPIARLPIIAGESGGGKTI